MQITYRPSREETAAERQRLYLEKWPIVRQLEAHGEATAGRPEKLKAMERDFAEIRGVLPYHEEAER